jgi:hypothetical protein
LVHRFRDGQDRQTRESKLTVPPSRNGWVCFSGQVMVRSIGWRHSHGDDEAGVKVDRDVTLVAV